MRVVLRREGEGERGGGEGACFGILGNGSCSIKVAFSSFR